MKLFIYIAFTVGLIFANLNVKSMEPNFYSLVSYQITTADSLSANMDDFLKQLQELTEKNQTIDILIDETWLVNRCIESKTPISYFISFTNKNRLEVYAVNAMEKVSIVQEINYYMPDMHN